MSPYIIDVAIIAVLILLIWRGVKRGLILSLFGLAAIFVCFAGGWFAAEYLSSPISTFIRPTIQSTLEGLLPEEMTAVSTDPETGEAVVESAYSLEEVLAALGESETFVGLLEPLTAAIEENTVTVLTTAVAAVADYLADMIAAALVFGVVFIALLLACFLISHTLDLAFKLPILAQVNQIGGGLFGLVQGVLLGVVAVWLLRLFGVLTDVNAGPVSSLMTVERLEELLRPLVE